MSKTHGEKKVGKAARTRLLAKLGAFSSDPSVRVNSGLWANGRSKGMLLSRRT